jgi:hypothetical protein
MGLTCGAKDILVECFGIVQYAYEFYSAWT